MVEFDISLQEILFLQRCGFLKKEYSPNDVRIALHRVISEYKGAVTPDKAYDKSVKSEPSK